MTLEIDDSLYNRQRYVLGDSAMKKLGSSDVLLYGIGVLGSEIAKNLVLAGIKSLTIQDYAVVSSADLGYHFFVREPDLLANGNRAACSARLLAELNPYVTIDTISSKMQLDDDFQYLDKFSCVVMTETCIELCLKVNQYCRSREPPIKFIMADVKGLFCRLFCDFGDIHDINDPDGEENKDIFLSHIYNTNPCLVETISNQPHNLVNGDVIIFKEIKSIPQLNYKMFVCDNVTTSSFILKEFDASHLPQYHDGGCLKKVKVPVQMSFNSLQEELTKPSLHIYDYAKEHYSLITHKGFLALDTFFNLENRATSPYDENDFEKFIEIMKTENIDDNITSNMSHLKALCHTSSSFLPPLCAFLGGITSQEVLKSVTEKFTPIRQWLYIDSFELYSDQESHSSYIDPLEITLGSELTSKLTEMRILMVGCGAIGCEMLKNMAVLNIGSNKEGQIIVIDDDLIEKSNLNRQFLFRSYHIGKYKCEIAAKSIHEVVPNINIKPQLMRMCPQNEHVFTDEVFKNQCIVVNALDNVETRRYVDGRCVNNQKSLLESGTMGLKGHVQVIVPFLTESYSNQQDPVDENIPYCTLKSFPSAVDHCIQWARDKFEAVFCQKPLAFNKFWESHSPSDTLQNLKSSSVCDGINIVNKIIHDRPHSISTCIQLARIKFEKYFNHKAKQLLHAFPPDTRLNDGSSFWQLPKRIPTPINFDIENVLHLHFISSTGKLIAIINCINFDENDFCLDQISVALLKMEIPQFEPRSKEIITDESIQKPISSGNSIDDIDTKLLSLEKYLEDTRINESCRFKMCSICFEKDDDANGHIDFVTSSANLRAVMYGIEPAERHIVKRIAGKIIPAIATVTSAVSGLLTIELLKIVKQCDLAHYKNTFMNLAIPLIVFSEPGNVPVTTIKNGLKFTIWDYWDVIGFHEMTLSAFLKYFIDNYSCQVTMVVQGARTLYMKFMPAHKKRLTQPMTKLIKNSPTSKYVLLYVSFADDDEMGPPVRYYFNGP